MWYPPWEKKFVCAKNSPYGTWGGKGAENPRKGKIVRRKSKKWANNAEQTEGYSILSKVSLECGESSRWGE